MYTIYTKFVSWRQLRSVTLVMMILLVLLLTTAASASAVNDQLMWVTVCHTQPGQAGNPQTMVLYWSALDKCLSSFNDFIGPCP